MHLTIGDHLALPNPIFDASFERLFGSTVALAPAADAFFDRFYAHFLEDEVVRSMFDGTDMTRQIAMLKRSLLHLVSFHVLDEPNAELSRLAERHADLRIPARLMDTWLSALLRTRCRVRPRVR